MSSRTIAWLKMVEKDPVGTPHTSFQFLGVILKTLNYSLTQNFGIIARAFKMSL